MTRIKDIIHGASNSQRIGFILLCVIILFGLFQPVIHHGSPYVTSLHNPLSAPNWQEPFGTDHLGRSMFARIGSAIRLSIGLALLSVLTAVIPGLALGVIAGWKGGVIDKTLSLLADAVAALPGLLLILLLSTIVPGSYFMLYIAIALVLWLEYFRVVRAQTRTYVASPHIEASQILGFGKWYCFRKHIWPGLAPSILTLAALGAGNSILALATLGFINVGLRPPVAELGLMMTELFPYIYDAPFILMQPILVVVGLVLSLNLLTRRTLQ